MLTYCHRNGDEVHDMDMAAIYTFKPMEQRAQHCEIIGSFRFFRINGFGSVEVITYFLIFFFNYRTHILERASLIDDKMVNLPGEKINEI